MKTFAKSAVLAGIVAVAPGCAIYGAVSDRVVERAGEAVDGYCTELPAESREAVRARMNDAAAPHVVRIECDGD